MVTAAEAAILFLKWTRGKIHLAISDITASISHEAAKKAANADVRGKMAKILLSKCRKVR